MNTPTSIFSQAEAPDDDAAITQSAANHEVPLGDINPYDHGAEQAAINAAQQTIGIAPPELPENQDTPIGNPGVMVDPTQDIHEEMQQRFKAMRANVVVDVTAADRDAFVRSALHDSELIFDILQEGVEATVAVAIPPEMFTAMVVEAIGQREASGALEKGNTMLWFLLFQQMHVLFQVRKVNGVPTEWASIWEGGIPSASVLRGILRNPDHLTKIEAMNAVRWRMCMDAIQIAEVKYANCMTNWRNRSFFTGADTV